PALRCPFRSGGAVRPTAGMELPSPPHRSFAGNRPDRALWRHRRDARPTGILIHVRWPHYRLDLRGTLCAVGFGWSPGHLLAAAGDAAGPQAHRLPAAAAAVRLALLGRNPRAHAALAAADEASGRRPRDLRAVGTALRSHPRGAGEWPAGACRRQWLALGGAVANPPGGNAAWAHGRHPRQPPGADRRHGRNRAGDYAIPRSRQGAENG